MRGGAAFSVAYGVPIASHWGSGPGPCRGRVATRVPPLTDALRREGLAREVVNRVQRARKEMDLAYEARIRVRYETEEELGEAIRAHAAWISSEILATELEPRGPSEKPGGVRHESKVEGTPIDVWIEVVGS